MGSLHLWGRSIHVMGGDVVIGRSIYRVVVIDGSLYSRFYGRVVICLHGCMLRCVDSIHKRAANDEYNYLTSCKHDRQVLESI